jgi:type IX secretion system PorP/SprF family membrane protein
MNTGKKYRRIGKQLKLLFLFSVIFCKIDFAQDAHFSQYYTVPLLLNPATTGMYDGATRINLAHRSQWASLTNNPYINDFVSFDRPYKKFGYGGYILNSRAGAGIMNETHIAASGGYEITIDPNKIHHLTTGIQLGLIQKSININKLTYDNQYNRDLGGFDTNINPGENFQNTNILLPEVNFGVYYYNQNPANNFKPYGGIAGYHLTQPKQVFLNNENRLPARIVGFWGTKFKLNEKFFADANFLYMKQTNNNLLNFGFLAYYHIEGSNTSFFMGPYYRNKDAAVIHTGVIYEQYYIRFSYDWNVSSLKAFSRSRGGFEISVSYLLEKRKYLPSIM